MSESVIKFAVEKGFFICENDVFDLPFEPIDKLTYIVLVRYADSQLQAWPSYVTLAAKVGVGKKRVIEAVKKLIDCRLLEKHPRGNRSNLYLVYPVRFFCARVAAGDDAGEDEKEGVQETPCASGEVSHGHRQGVPRTPSGCPTDTVRVSHGHPISTSISTNIKNLSLKEEEREEFLIHKKNEKPDDTEAVKNCVQRKGYEISDKVVSEMLAKYTYAEVSAAISCTDFKLARNPLAVIYALLQSGRFLVPRRAAPPAEKVITEEAGVVDPGVVKSYMSRLKENLEKEAAGDERVDQAIRG